MTELPTLFTLDLQRLPSKTLRLFFTIVLHNVPEALGVDEIAARTTVSRQALAKALRQCGMHSPLWYISNARLLRAACLLQTTEMSAASIAEELRFGKSSNLYNMFEMYTGVSFAKLPRQKALHVMVRWYRAGLQPGSAKRHPVVLNIGKK